MKSVLILLASLSAAVLIFVGGVAVASYVISDPEPHRLANVDAPDLWTSRPVAVDLSKQNYERLEALPAIAALPASSGRKQMPTAPSSNETTIAAVSDYSDPAVGIDGAATGALPSDPGQQPQAIDPQHADWCFARYRSYRMEDDSYQPYGGGPRQQCQSPWTPMAQDEYPVGDQFSGETVDTASPSFAEEPAGYAEEAAPIEQAAASHHDAPVGAHEEWCFARYRSYRAEDNSYQPFDGSARRVCSSPYG